MSSNTNPVNSPDNLEIVDTLTQEVLMVTGEFQKPTEIETSAGSCFYDRGLGLYLGYFVVITDNGASYHTTTCHHDRFGQRGQLVTEMKAIEQGKKPCKLCNPQENPVKMPGAVLRPITKKKPSRFNVICAKNGL